ncbi:unnamed protein product [Angiostrongylus costaricensis]|uniref:Phospholipid scramblase n=1 Tax=Angiostrongylus costaricensis TaxID=334426 RepID=A0A158PFF0_ANGCS|nr:unnamed protein product [Angiostrongylus costaricensis]
MNDFQKNCDVDIELNELDIGMNRRSWTGLVDFLGLLGTEETEFNCIQKENQESDLATESKVNALCVGCTLRVRSWRINMNYPANSTRLGVIRVENAVISTQISKTNFRHIFFYGSNLIVVQQRRLETLTKFVLKVIFLGEDATRECDLQVNIVVPETMKFYYVHTHRASCLSLMNSFRFFCGLLDFWAQFSELQDQVAKSKRTVVIDEVRSKISLNINVKCPATVVLPLNQFSDDLVVLESDGFRLTNSFNRMGTIKDFFQKNFIDTDYGYAVRKPNAILGDGGIGSSFRI